MRYRRSVSVIGLALLSVLSTGQISRAGAIGYEALDGAQCRVTTNTPSTMNLESGWNENMGANISFGLTIPLSDPTSSARTNCVEFAQQDQARQHFTWLLDMYERGVISREALETEAKKLGMNLAPEKVIDTDGSSVLLIE